MRDLTIICERLVKCKDRRDNAVVRAVGLGFSYSEIGEAVGLSKQGVKLKVDAAPYIYVHNGMQITRQHWDSMTSELNSIRDEYKSLRHHRADYIARARALGLTLTAIGKACSLNPKTIRIILDNLDYMYEIDDAEIDVG